MTTILHVSDPHFGAERPEVVSALTALAHELAPEVLVLSGDITQRARRAQFEAARAFVERLRIGEVLALPGNHDIPLFDLPSRLRDPYGGYRAAFGGNLEPALSRSDCMLLAVKTTRRYRHVDGEISAEQRRRVAESLGRASPQQLRVVVLHQPVAVPRVSEEHNVCHGSEPAVRAWAEAGADVILAGHIHLPFALPLDEVYPGLSRRVWAINAGTAVSQRVRYDAGNSVNVLRTERGGDGERVCFLEQWSYAASSSGFRRGSELRLSFA